MAGTAHTSRSDSSRGGPVDTNLSFMTNRGARRLDVAGVRPAARRRRMVAGRGRSRTNGSHGRRHARAVSGGRWLVVSVLAGRARRCRHARARSPRWGLVGAKTAAAEGPSIAASTTGSDRRRASSGLEAHEVAPGISMCFCRRPMTSTGENDSDAVDLDTSARQRHRASGATGSTPPPRSRAISPYANARVAGRRHPDRSVALTGATVSRGTSRKRFGRVGGACGRLSAGHQQPPPDAPRADRGTSGQP